MHKAKIEAAVEIAINASKMSPSDAAGPCGPVVPVSPFDPCAPLSPLGPCGPVMLTTVNVAVAQLPNWSVALTV